MKTVSLNIMKRMLLAAFVGMMAASASAQTQEYTELHQGNRAYLRGDWAKAEQHYRKALEINPKNTRAMFDLGDAFLAQENHEEAMKYFEKVVKAEQNKTVKALAHHNVGYIHQKKKEYDAAIEAYKDALRNNPHDEDTRYNLALCQKLKQQQDQQQKQQEQKEKENEKNQDDKQDQQDRNKEKQQKEDQQQQPEQMPQENIDQLLELARQTEQQTRQKIQEAKQPRRRQLGKNW